MPVELVMPTPADAKNVGQELMTRFSERTIFTFTGDLGAGKTTLIKAICEEVLGVEDDTSSPSFSLVNEYRASSGDPVYHFDLYRLKNAEELEGIGIDEYFSSGYRCFVEWPELALDRMPHDTVHVRMRAEGDERYLSIEA